MFKTVFNWFVRAETSVENIMSSFHTTIAKLEAHGAAKFAEADRHTHAIAEAAAKQGAAIEEGQKAMVAAQKIGTLVSA